MIGKKYLEICTLAALLLIVNMYSSHSNIAITDHLIDHEATHLTDMYVQNLTKSSEDVITIGPYLQNVQMDSITVCFITSNATIATVEYGTDGNFQYSVSDSGAVSNHQIILNGLTPDTIYNYRIKVGNYTSMTYTFKTAQALVHPFKFFVYGDSRSNHTAHRTVVNQMLNFDGDFVLHTGDLVSDGSNPDDWPPFFDVINTLAANHTYYPCLGNHEDNSQYYYDYFALPGNERWYSFDYGQVHFIVLDTNDYTTYMQGSAQYQWLKNDLMANQEDWKFIFVMFHQPPYSGTNRDPNYLIRNTLVPLFEQYGVDLVFNGHDHYYCHSFKNNIHYVVTGGGGAPLYDPYENGDREWIIYAESTYHFIQVSVDNGYCTVRAIRADGTEIENFTISVENKAPGAVEVYAMDTYYDYGGSITVEWTQSSDDGGGEDDVLGYDLYRMDNLSMTWKLIASLPKGQTRYIDDSVMDGIDYYYLVVVTDGIYHVASNIFGPVQSYDDTVPEAPTNLVAEDVLGDNGGRIVLTWQRSPASDVMWYYIYRDTVADTTFPESTFIAQVPYTENSYTDTGLQNNIPYYYCVRAFDGTNLSPKSNVAGPVMARWDDAPYPPPYFTAMDVPDDDGGCIKLEWHLSPDDGKGDNDVVEYHIYRRTSGSAYGIVPNITVPKGTTEYLDSFVSDNVEYYYMIRAYDGYLESEAREYGPVRSINNHIPSPPTDLRAYNIRDRWLKLEWSRSPENFVVGYQIYINASPVAENIYYGKYEGEYDLLMEVEDPETGEKVRVVIDGLMESTMYSFKVVSYSNRSVTSNFEDSPSIIVTTLNPPTIGEITYYPEDVLNKPGFVFRIYVKINDLDGPDDIMSVTIDLTPLGLALNNMVDDGTHGDKVALDGIYTIEIEMPDGVKAGKYRFDVNATDMTLLSRTGVATITVKDYREFQDLGPEIKAKVPDKTIIYLYPGENITLKVVAIDPEDKGLEFSWYVNKVKVEGEGESYVFYAVNPGDYIVKVIVKDAGGNKRETFWSISVVTHTTESKEQEETEKTEIGSHSDNILVSVAIALVAIFIILIMVLYTLRSGRTNHKNKGDKEENNKKQERAS